MPLGDVVCWRVKEKSAVGIEFSLMYEVEELERVGGDTVEGRGFAQDKFFSVVLNARKVMG